jgi:hypothetical protein
MVYQIFIQGRQCVLQEIDTTIAKSYDGELRTHEGDLRLPLQEIWHN